MFYEWRYRSLYVRMAGCVCVSAGRVDCFADTMSVLHDTEALMYGMQYQVMYVETKELSQSQKLHKKVRHLGRQVLHLLWCGVFPV